MSASPPFNMPGYTWDPERQRFFKAPPQRAKVEATRPPKRKLESASSAVSPDMSAGPSNVRPPAPRVLPAVRSAFRTPSAWSGIERLRLGLERPAQAKSQLDRLWVGQMELLPLNPPRVGELQRGFNAPGMAAAVTRVYWIDCSQLEVRRRLPCTKYFDDGTAGKGALVVGWESVGQHLAILGAGSCRWLGYLAPEEPTVQLHAFGDLCAWTGAHRAWGSPLVLSHAGSIPSNNLLRQLLTHRLPSTFGLDICPRPPGTLGSCSCAGTLSIDDRRWSFDLATSGPVIAPNGPYIFCADKNGMYLVTTTPTKRRWWYWCKHFSVPFPPASYAADTLRSLFHWHPDESFACTDDQPRPDVMAACANKRTLLLGYRDGRVARMDRQYAVPTVSPGHEADALDDEAEDVDYPIFRGWIQDLHGPGRPSGTSETSVKHRDPVRHIFPWSAPGEVERVLVVHASGAGRLWELPPPGSLPRFQLAILRAKLEHPDTHLSPKADELQGVPIPTAALYPLVAMVCLDGLVRIWKVDISDLPDSTRSAPVKFAPLTEPVLVPAPEPTLERRAEQLAHPLHRSQELSRASPAPAPRAVFAAKPPSELGRLNATRFDPLNIHQLTWLPPCAASPLVEEPASTAQPCLVITTKTAGWIALVRQHHYGPKNDLEKHGRGCSNAEDSPAGSSRTVHSVGGGPRQAAARQSPDEDEDGRPVSGSEWSE